MFEITGRQYKALAEIAKNAAKKHKELANSAVIINGRLYVTDGVIALCIEDDRLKEIPDWAYLGCFCEKVKVTDRVRFLPDGNIEIGDKDGRCWNRVNLDDTNDKTTSYMSAVSKLFRHIGECKKFAEDVPLIAMNPKDLNIVSQIFADFNLNVALGTLEVVDPYNDGAYSQAIVSFKSYREISQGKQPGFHISAYYMSMREYL